MLNEWELGFIGATKSSSGVKELCAEAWAALLVLQFGWQCEVIIEFDSEYAAGIATAKFEAKTNGALASVAAVLCNTALSVTSTQWKHVYGHSNDPWNEFADSLCDSVSTHGVTTWSTLCPISELASTNPRAVEQLHLVDPWRRRSDELPPISNGTVDVSRHDGGERLGLAPATLAAKFDATQAVSTSDDKVEVMEWRVVSCNPMCLRQAWRKDAFERQAADMEWSIFGVQEQRDTATGVFMQGDYIVAAAGCSPPANHGSAVWISSTQVLAKVIGLRFVLHLMRLISFMMIRVASLCYCGLRPLLFSTSHCMHLMVTQMTSEFGRKKPFS